jgi:RNA polymerase sigma-70 factor (ECF subfamily)
VSVSRARPVTAPTHHRFLETFLRAARTGDARALESLLAEDSVSYTDGGGVVRRTARRPILGRDKLVRFLLGVSRWFWGDVAVQLIDANGRSAALLRRSERIFALLTITVSAGAVTQVMWVMSPMKLASIALAYEYPDAGTEMQREQLNRMLPIA